jgi:hypothetical protein
MLAFARNHLRTILAAGAIGAMALAVAPLSYAANPSNTGPLTFLGCGWRGDSRIYRPNYTSGNAQTWQLDDMCLVAIYATYVYYTGGAWHTDVSGWVGGNYAVASGSGSYISNTYGYHQAMKPLWNMSATFETHAVP